MKNILKTGASDQLDKRMDLCILNGNKFIENNLHEWRLTYDVDLEVTNHVIRCKASDRTISNYYKDVIDLTKCQNSDGGWGDKRDDPDSKVRSSALTIQMLLRSNRILNDKTVSASISRGLCYLLAKQDGEGRWFDPTWHYLDAISVAVGALLFAVNQPEWFNSLYANSLKMGIAHIRTQRNTEGFWFYKSTGSPVTITAHLLPKCVAFDGVHDIDITSVYSLIKLQSPEGHWDDLNTDHTCDSIRAMMLTASRAGSQDLYEAVYESSRKAIEWLLDASENIGGGLGDKPGMLAHVERTCDGMDSIMKFQQFCKDEQNLINFWK